MHFKKKKTEKVFQSYRELYLQFSIQLKLYMDDQLVNIHNIFLIPIMFLSFLQNISFIFENYYFSNHEHNGFRQLFLGLSKFTRPYLILQNDFQAISFMIPLFIIITAELIGIYLFCCFLQLKKLKRISEIINDQKRTLQIVIVIIAFIYQIQYYLLIIPFLEMNIFSINYYSKSENFNIFGLTFAFIGFFFLTIIILFYQICIQQSLNIKVKNLNMLVQSFNHYLNPIFQLLFVFLNTFNTSSKSIKFYLIAAIIILKSVFNIYSLYSTLQNPKRRILKELFFESLQLSVALILTFIELSKFKSESEDFETELILIISPLFAYIPTILFKIHHEKIMLNSKKFLLPQIQLYQISSIIEELGETRNSYIQDNEQITFLINFKLNHIQNCSTVKCICNQQQLTFQQVLNQYLKDQVTTFNHSIDKIKQQSIRQFYFLHYLSLIHYLGLSTKAFQQSNIIIYQESDNHSSSYSKAKSALRAATVSSQEKQSSAQKSQIDSKQDEITQIKVGNLNMIQKQRLLIIQENIKISMSNGLGKKEDQIFSDNLEHAVKLFLKAEENNQQLKYKIIKIINKKKDFFLNLSMANINFKLFDEAKMMILKMTQLEEQLLKLYTQFPSRKMQALNTFYQSEVMNNYFQAYKLATVTSISDEKLFKMQSQINFDLFSNKIDYLIIGFDDKSHKLNIRQSSNQIHEFFGISFEKFKLLKSLDHFLPSNFELIHQKLVSNFLQTGVSKYFRQINGSYCRYQHKFIKSIDFFFDINISNLNDLTFAGFLQELEASNAVIFCSNNDKIENISKNLTQKLGYQQKLIQPLFDSLKKQSLKRIFPKLQIGLESQSKFSNEPEELDQEIFNQSEYSIQMYMPDEEILNRNVANCWESDSNLQTFQVDLVYHSRKMKLEQSINYSIIEIREAKKFYKSYSTPQQTENVIESQKVSFSQQQEQDMEEFNNDFEWFEEQESNINLPRAIEFDFQEDIKQQNFEDSDLKFGKKLQDNQKNQSQSFYPNVSLISPKDAALKLIDSKIIDGGGFYDSNSKRNIEAKQQFFSAVNQKEVSSEAQSESQAKGTSNQKPSKCIDQLQMEEIDKELQENILMQMQLEEQNQNVAAIDDIGSQVSSVAAFKKSKYSKKYDLIQKLITSQKFSIYFYQTRLFLFILLILFAIFSIVEIIFSTDDLNRFLQELDMVQIKSNIIAPIDNYIVAQNAVMFYALRSLIGMMPREVASQKLVYSQNDISYNYEELKASYIKQLSNKYLNPFFQDKNFTIMVSEQITTSNKNVSAREALYLSLEAAYQFVLLDYQNIFTSLDPTSGFFVYLFGNYQTFYEQLTIVNKDMLEYSVNRSVQVKQKWLTLMIPTLILGFLLLGIIIKFHQLYLGQYDQFLSLFSFLEIVWLQRDIDRYKGITNLVTKDSDVLFKYQFDIDLKEKFLAAEDIRKEKIAQNQKSQKQKSKAITINFNQKTKKIPSIVVYSTIYTICFSLCFLSTSLGGSYVNQYADTTNFFNRLCEISIASTGAFSQRQIVYAVESTASDAFFFIKSSQFFINVFNEHIKTIEDFLALMSQFYPSSIITSDVFVQKMQSLMSSDICEFLPSYKIESAQIHCDSVYGGVVRRGLTATLSTVRSALLNEFQTSKNFTVQAYSLNEELEIGLLCYDALSNLKSQFQSELINFTHNLIESILIINICSIIIYFLVMIFYYITITRIYYDEFKQVLKFILLIPQTSLFLDSQLDRNIKQLIIKNDLI